MTKVSEVSASRSIYSKLNLAGGILSGVAMAIPVGLWAGGLLTGALRDVPRVFLPGVILLVPAHEGVHWLAAVLLGVPRRECHFGFYWQKLMPYFRAKVPVPVRSYRLILLAPGVLLFGGLLVPALMTRNVSWTILAGTALVAGVGDFYWLWRIRSLPRDRWVWDRAGLVGLEVLVEE